jgi:hypothetical protein
VRDRIHAALVIATRQVQESLLTPGSYIMLSLSLGLGCALAAGFTVSIDSSGFNPELSGLYGFISSLIAGAFGASVLEALFAEGPFAFALLACFLPLLVYLAVSSVFRFGQEKSAGAIELLAFGPADGTSYVLATLLKDAVMSALSLLILGAGLLAAAAVTHLAPGSLFFWTLALLFLLSLSVFAYGSFCSILASTAASALALFIGLQFVFFILLAGSFAIVSGPVRTLSSLAGSILQWVSPLYFAGLCVRGVQSADPALFAAGATLLIGLAALLLAACHLLIDRKGVRA